MRSYILVSAFAAAVIAADQSSSTSSVDAHPQTTFLQQTNSLGVVTGQPVAATSQPTQPAADNSQPAAASSQPPVITIPAVGTTGVHTVTIGVPGTNSTNTLTVSAANSTTSVIGDLPTGVSVSGVTTSGGASRSAGASGSGASGSGSGTESGSQAAAPTMKAVAGSLIGAGAFVAAFL